MKKVRWGVIGAGGIADRRTIPGMLLADNAELVAVMDVSMELAERLRAKHGAKRAYCDCRELLADPEIDAVYIATPVACHREQALAAIEAGKHILIEKPVCLTADEGEEIIKKCREKGLLIAAGFLMRFSSSHRAMRDMIAAGRLGQIVSVRAQFSCWYPKMEGAWRQSKALGGGGALMDMGIHCIDLVGFITGSEIKRVSAFCANNVFDYETEDQAAAIMELENGAFAIVDTNFNIPDASQRARLEIYGTKGSILAEGTIAQDDAGRVELLISEEKGYDAQQTRSIGGAELLETEKVNMYTQEIASFGRSLLTGAPLEVPAEEAIKVQRVIEAAYRSSEEGRAVAL